MYEHVPSIYFFLFLFLFKYCRHISQGKNNNNKTFYSTFIYLSFYLIINLYIYASMNIVRTDKVTCKGCFAPKIELFNV